MTKLSNCMQIANIYVTFLGKIFMFFCVGNEKIC